MAFLLDPDDRRPIYLQIMDEVRRVRVLGLLPIEEPLPSVRQLAADLQVNPNTVAQAYRELEREGVVWVQRGLGTFLTAGKPAEIDGDRARLAQAIARRALNDAARHGLTPRQLLEAIREADRVPQSPPGKRVK